MSWYSDQPFQVYVISAGDHQKVGSTSALKTRVAQLQWAHYADLELVFSVSLDSLAAARRVEHYAHGLLADHHVRGEWFRVEPQAAIDAVGVAQDEVRRGGKIFFETRLTVGPHRTPVLNRVKVLRRPIVEGVGR
jgi:hypothetical protein